MHCDVPMALHRRAYCLHIVIVILLLILPYTVSLTTWCLPFHSPINIIACILGKCIVLWGEPEQATVVYVVMHAQKRLASYYCRLRRIHTYVLAQSSVLFDVILVVVQAV